MLLDRRFDFIAKGGNAIHIGTTLGQACSERGRM